MSTVVKKCSVCEEEKELHLFGKKRTGIFGVSRRCKACKNIYNKEYNARSKVKEEKKKYNIQYLKNNKCRIYRQNKEYRSRGAVKEAIIIDPVAGA